MDKIRLSFCIPTYNFGAFIGETLDSILGQANDELEVIVGDGASTDQTAEVVRRYQASFRRLTYCNFGRKGGFDLDLSKTVGLARGDYCWLMSSDDVLKSGAVRRILAEIERGHDVYLLNRDLCDRHLKLKRRKLWLTRKMGDGVYQFSNKSDLMSYLRNSRSIGALFSYVSSIVVKRQEWNRVGFDERFAGCNYAHVFRLFSILEAKGRSLKYLRDPMLLCRGGNDSFQHDGIINRFRIDFDGYRRLADEPMFRDDEVRDALKQVMRREHPWYNLSKLRTELKDDREWNQLESTLANYDYRGGELLLIRMLASSKVLVKFLRSIRGSLVI